MSSTEDTINPYASPEETVDVASAPPQKNPELKQVSLANALTRWTLICAISAAPSFVCGVIMTRHSFAVPMMLLGVTVFAVVYAYIDRGSRWRRWMSRPLTRRCIMWAYGIRMTASILFPVGMYNDALVGLASVGAVGAVSSVLTDSNTPELNNPLQVFLTTIIQGILLNLEIFLLVLLLIGLNHVFLALKGTFSSATSA